MHARLAALGVCALFGLAACASSSPSGGSSASQASPTVTETSASTDSAAPSPGSTLICDAAALGQAMDTTTTDDAKLVQLADVACADGWAFAVAISQVTSTTTVQSIVLFQQTPDGWVQQDREGSCRAGVVPESLRAAACEAP